MASALYRVKIQYIAPIGVCPATRYQEALPCDGVDNQRRMACRVQARIACSLLDGELEATCRPRHLRWLQDIGDLFLG
jgi:hypothetical protein